MAAEKNSLVRNINRRKRAGKSRSKSASSVSKDSYEQMEEGWPNSRKASAKKKTGTKKAGTKKAPKKAGTKKAPKKAGTKKAAKKR